MKIRDLFTLRVDRDIPPVVYFHEQSPERLASEVSEYIITGGYPAGDPRVRRLPEGQGIHEQFVQLLSAIRVELDKPGGPELPACWISGFYGSGKSSFAKLLGLALDGKKLPDGTPLADALLRRDDSLRARELHDAWHALRSKIDPISIVFDIGGVARGDEHIHYAVVRQLQRRLGYCTTSSHVADHELKLQIDGEWTEFQSAARRTLAKPWEEAKDSQQADDLFSHVMHVMHPDRFTDPQSWLDSRAGKVSSAGTSVEEVTGTIAAMRSFRAPGKTIFLVVDEVSQYIAEQDLRMLALQSFASQLGQQLRGAVWLLATGQQKLDNDASMATVVGKLKDRFPPQLRVHLSPSNIRDVVHRRLLTKAKDKESVLRDLFRKHRPELKRFGYAAGEITEEEFLEVYPMLPGHIDLLLDITTALRTRSTRVQGDDHAIRGLLQLLGEIFRGKGGGDNGLANREVGDLVTLDAIFDVQETALDADVQASLARIFENVDRDGGDPQTPGPAGSRDSLAARAVKAVALLELVQEKMPTTAELVASCLYDRLGRESQVEAVTQALEGLRGANLIGYSEKLGYKIQSSAGQEWQRERGDIPVPPEAYGELISGKLKLLVAEPSAPKLKGRPFPWGALYSDHRKASDARVKNPDDDAVTVDFRYVKTDEQHSTEWVKRTNEEPLVNRIVWVVGDPGQVDYLVRELYRSQKMTAHYNDRRASNTRDKQRLLLEEEARAEDLESDLKDAVAAAFYGGTMYFRSRPVAPKDLGGAFATALAVMGNRVLPELYPHFTEIAVTATELKQLLEPTLSGPSSKFLEGGLGILSLDAGKYVPTCAGPVPVRVLSTIEAQGGTTGQILLSTFARPPYGYPGDVIRACLAGLLRAGRIRIRPESGKDITSPRDEGARDLFRLERDLNRATILPKGTGPVGPRDRTAICRFLKESLGVDIDREDDKIADAVYDHLLPQRRELRDVELLLARLPGSPRPPAALAKLAHAFDECARSRQVEPTVIAVKDNLDALRDGFLQLGIYRTEITDEAIAKVIEAARVQGQELAQLEVVDPESPWLRESAARVRAQLADERPWRDIGALEPDLRKIHEAYVESRRTLLNQQERDAEEARVAVKGRPGFERFKADDSHHVLRPIADARFDTTAEASSPALIDLRDRFKGRLDAALQEANDRLDAKLAADEKKPTPVVKIATHLAGKEIATRDQLKALLTELETRIGAQLDKGLRVRLL
jgi:hypothetical protein